MADRNLVSVGSVDHKKLFDEAAENVANENQTQIKNADVPFPSDDEETRGHYPLEQDQEEGEDEFVVVKPDPPGEESRHSEDYDEKESSSSRSPSSSHDFSFSLSDSSPASGGTMEVQEGQDSVGGSSSLRVAEDGQRYQEEEEEEEEEEVEEAASHLPSSLEQTAANETTNQNPDNNNNNNSNNTPSDRDRRQRSRSAGDPNHSDFPWEQQEQFDNYRRRQRRRELLTFLCIPCMFLFSLFMLFMMLIFMGLPFCLFLLCLLSAYYCCTSDPLPPRVLLRALLDTDDWNAGPHGGDHFHRRFTSKGEIEKELIQRICLGNTRARAKAPHIGQCLGSVERNHRGRVHWRFEHDADHVVSSGEDRTEEFDCLVFSEPLRESNKNDIAQQVKEFHENNKATNGNPSNDDQDVELGLPGAAALAFLEEAVDVRSHFREDDLDATSVRERGTCCDICLIHFQSGDVIAWSTNSLCDHAYHSDCITDWLLRQPTCPSCRQEYLPPRNVEEGERDTRMGAEDSLSSEVSPSDNDDVSIDNGEDDENVEDGENRSDAEDLVLALETLSESSTQGTHLASSTHGTSVNSCEESVSDR